MITIQGLITWAIIGLIGGTLAGKVVTWEKKGFGLVKNLGLGVAGAIVGGLLFRWLGILPGLDAISVSMRDIVAAVAGALVVLAAMWMFWPKKKAAPAPDA